MSCHSGSVLVFKRGGLRIYGGGNQYGLHTWPGLRAIDLAGGLMGATDRIPWPNHSVPTKASEFWRGLADTLTGDVLFACRGGHGRTGTALAIIGCMLQFIPEDANPMLWVRKHYCHKAIERTSQIRYIESITGRRIR